MIDPTMMGLGGPPAGGPPPSISLPGAGGGEPPAEAGGGDPAVLMREALESVRKAAVAEPDDEDQALLEKIGADIAKYLATQQKLVDTATGAGAGEKLVRKVTRAGGGSY